MDLRHAIDIVGDFIDAAGVVLLVLGVLMATGNFLLRWGRAGLSDAYAGYRRGLGRAILIGLELLVAADIIRTVAIEPTLEKAAALGLIVLIRTFLSFSIEVEVEGRWPWQQRGTPDRLS